jgi:hypothetical protein
MTQSDKFPERFLVSITIVDAKTLVLNQILSVIVVVAHEGAGTLDEFPILSILKLMYLQLLEYSAG